MQEKIAKTYRLSKKALNAVENRDRKIYPSATDFLEAKILAPTESISEMLNKVSLQLEEIRSLCEKEEEERIFKKNPF